LTRRSENSRNCTRMRDTIVAQEHNDSRERGTMSADTHKPSEEVIVGENDLRWWQDLAPTLMWRFAKTMPRSPHSYVVQGDGNGLSKEDYRRAARVIWTYGRPATYNGGWKLYLDAPAPSPERTPNLRRTEHHDEIGRATCRESG